HGAICLRYHDPRNQPVCFNYGVTSFGDGPVLFWRFLRSAQRFWVEPSPWRRMIGFYTGEDRDIWSQRLPLTGEQARAIEARLWDSLREDRRFYTYDHFRDNCSTRLRDLIDEVTGGKLRAGADEPYPLTYRELGRRGLVELPPLLVLSDFLIGRPADERPTLWAAMFRPDVLRRAVEERLGAAPQRIYERRGPPFPASGSSGRLELAAIGLVLALPLLLARGLARLALIAAAAHLALWGAIVWAAVILSPIPDVRWNEAVLVVTPLDAALPLLGPALRRG